MVTSVRVKQQYTGAVVNQVSTVGCAGLHMHNAERTCQLLDALRCTGYADEVFVEVLDVPGHFLRRVAFRSDTHEDVANVVTGICQLVRDAVQYRECCGANIRTMSVAEEYE